MLISMEWLGDYVRTSVDADELAGRFAMSGLNHESTTRLPSDIVLDLEVTSNRSDLLGHIGVAREAATLLDENLKIPAVTSRPAASHSGGGLTLVNQLPEGCRRFTARIIRGVRVGPSPEWLVRRLGAIGVASVNNIVDVTNYVMFECGQPTHAFDASAVRGGTIIVRGGNPEETIEAIDHATYDLTAETIVIADQQGAIGIGGVMGGVGSEITSKTTDVILESAWFEPLWIRRTARRLRLASAASYRFERRVDPAGVDWAADRCVDLICQLAGGTAETFSLQTDPPQLEVPNIAFDNAAVTRVMGVELPWRTSLTVLEKLGCQISPAEGDAAAKVEVRPPTFRHDLSRPIDLVEEIARIVGYDTISEDAVVPIAAVTVPIADRVLERVRDVLTAAGYFEVITPSCVQQSLTQWFDPWDIGEPQRTITPMLEGADCLRTNLMASLLSTRLHNRSQHTEAVRLFESAHVYGPEREPWRLGLVSDDPFAVVKGVIEEAIEAVGGRNGDWATTQSRGLADGTGIHCRMGEAVVAKMGYLSGQLRKQLKFPQGAVLAELDLDVLVGCFASEPRISALPKYPAVNRDLNFLIDEAVSWRQLTAAVTACREPLLQQVEYRETYRDAKRDGPNKKRVLVSVVLADPEATLVAADADRAVDSIVGSVASEIGGTLIGVEGA